MNRVGLVCMWLLAVSLGASAQADTVRAKRAFPDSASPFMRIFGMAYPPYGFVQFCQREPGECAGSSTRSERFDATPVRLSELDAVNRWVNRTIAPATDMELYGVSEFWTLPRNGKGDCEDYVLLKRHILIERGWPPDAVLITVVRDERGEGHAVLTARTSQGDFILDNTYPDVRLWNQTPYHFMMRQSFTDPRAWVSLDPAEAIRTAPLTSMQGRRP